MASLPWDDLEEIRTATDAFWNAVADRLRHAGLEDVPNALYRGEDYEMPWRSGRLLLSQCCGFDLLLPFADRLQIVATPYYRAPGCREWRYRSMVVVRTDSPFRTLKDLRGARCVINSPTSHSGMNILRAIVAPLHKDGRFFSSVEISGAHERSVEMVRRSRADVAAIDVVTYELLLRHRPAELDGLRVLCQTDTYPAPPFVTSKDAPPARVNLLRSALADACADTTVRWATELLLLDTIRHVPLSAYQAIGELELWALEHGYREMSFAVALQPSG